MSKFIRQFRRSFKVGDKLMYGQLRWSVDYIGAEAVVLTNLSSPACEECVFWGRCYNWRKAIR